MTAPRPADRREQIAARLAAIRARIVHAAAAAGRDPSQITLIAVTKTWPASDIALLCELGVRDMGENRDQEAAAKVARVAELTGGAAVRWHFVGQLQRNKVRSVVSYAAMVHSVDRPRLVAALDEASRAANRQLPVCLQVRLDPVTGAGRGGADPADVPRLADQIAGTAGLALRGVMAVAPQGLPARPSFARLRRVADRLRADHPDATVISAGMSGDFEQAILEGATHLRVGSALLGSRPERP